MLDPSTWQGLHWRCIGPPRGGRVLAVAGHPTDSRVFYFGGCAGGVWKTDDGGTYWRNISDGYLKSAAVGAIAVSESDPNVIYIGMGEATIRGDVSYGDGVYKSTDGGQSWLHLGLEDTHHIAEIRIHPNNPDLVYVAAFGHAFGPNSERGVYRSQDGGQSWEQILFKSDKAGAIDLSMDVTNPRILYATIYEAYRNFWSLSSGGPDSSIYKSVDGGDSWVDITDNKGLPSGIKGKMGVTVSPANPNRVWAIIEAEDAGVYRSDDGGQSWTMLTDDRKLLARPWYYCHIFADPQDPDTVYVTNLKMWKSTDGGRTFDEITTPHGDNHDLWIDPTNPQRMIEGNDGGACVSYNGGITWSTIYNQMTSQFYHVNTDNQHPFRVYGTQQDNSSISVPSATEWGCIPWQSCYPAGTGESGHIVVHPEDSNIVYVGAIGSSPGGGGALQRYDHRTKQLRLVTVWPEMYSGLHPKDLKYRFAWTFPIAFSPHDANILYAAGNHIFRSRNEGQSWEVISPDLSRAEEETLMASGGPLTLDTSGAEHYGTVFAFAESPHDPGLLWAGTDDGLVHISCDHGEVWNDITPADLEPRTLISHIELSVHDDRTAYLAATRYKLDDYEPYLYRTEDFGKNWTKLNFPAGEITRVVREDPVTEGLLFVGTETGIFVSFNDGVSWDRIESNFPVVPVYDMVIKGDALVVGTHGRAFWVLDDITPLRMMKSVVGPVYLFPPATTTRLWLQWSVGAFGTSTAGKNYMVGLGATGTGEPHILEDGTFVNKMLDSGENPARGAIIYYFLYEKDGTPVVITIKDAEGNVINEYRSDSDKPGRPTNNIGLNRFVWDMRYPDATKLEGDPLTENSRLAPLAPPGEYYVQLEVLEHTQVTHFSLVKDPRLDTTQGDFIAQFDLWTAVRDKVSAVHEAVLRIRQLREQVNAWTARAAKHEDVKAAADGLLAKLDSVEHALVQTEAKTAFDRLRLPVKLNAKLATLVSVVGIADAAPTHQAHDVFATLAEQTDAELAKLEKIIDEDIAAFNQLVANSEINAISI